MRSLVNKALNLSLRKIICIVIVWILMLTLALKYFSASENSDWNDWLSSKSGGQPLKSEYNVHGDKWIVLTSIQHPTSSVVALAKMTGWKVVVVGDVKTPPDWKHPGVTYLDINQQDKLPYKLAYALPKKCYHRKNLGFLFAIHHGAKYIYNTDDDNLPKFNFTHLNLEQEMEVFYPKANNLLTYNPYVQFGQSTIWPRGYPIDQLKVPHPREYCTKNKKNIYVVQYLQNVAPDFDALFILVRRGTTTPIIYDNNAPPTVIPENTYSPFNSQATLIHQQAFWSLFLPVGSNMRTTDIYSGYIAQRLLWELSGSLVFMSPLVDHLRNFHNILNDFYDEFDFFHFTKLLKLMNDWQCTDDNLPNCYRSLYSLLVKEKYLDKNEVKFATLWIEDLISIGYKFPLMQKKKNDECIRDYIFFPVEQKTPVLNYDVSHLHLMKNEEKTNNYLKNICSIRQSVITVEPVMKDVIIIIHLTSTTNVPILLSLYENFFTRVIFCGKEDLMKESVFIEWEVSYTVIKPNENPLMQCLLNSVFIHPHAAGYLFTSGEQILDLKQIIPLDKNLIWMNSMAGFKIQPVCLELMSSSLQKAFYGLLSDVGQKKYEYSNDHDSCMKNLTASKPPNPSISNPLMLYLPHQQTSFLHSSIFNSNCINFLVTFLTDCLKHNHIKLEAPFFSGKITNFKDNPFCQNLKLLI